MSRLANKSKPVPKESKQDTYLQFQARERTDYDYIYVDAKNQVQVMVPLTAGDTIATDNTCRTTNELRTFFGFNNQSARGVINRYIEDLIFDLALLAKHPGKDVQPLINIMQSKQSRLKQLQEYQRFFARTIDGFFGEGEYRYPTSIQLKLAQPGTNCVIYNLSPLNPAASPGTDLQGLFSLKQSYENYPRSAAPFHWTLVDGLNAAEVISLVSKNKKNKSQINSQITKTVVANFKNKKKQVANEEDFNALKQAIIIEYQKFFPDEKVKLPTITYTAVSTTFFCESSDNLKTWIEAILSFGKNKSDLNYGADGEEKKKRQLDSKHQPVTDVFLKIAKWVKEKNTNYRMNRFYMAVQFCIATINSHYYLLTNHWLNFGSALDHNPALRASLIAAIKKAIYSKQNIDDVIFHFINTKYRNFGMQQTIAQTDWAIIKQTFHNQFLQIYGAFHFDEFIVLLPQKTSGPFYSMRHKIVLPLAEYFKDSRDYKVPAKGEIAHPTHRLEFNYVEKLDFTLNLSALLTSKKNPSSFLINLLLQTQNGKKLALQVSPEIIQTIKKSRYGENIISAIYARLSSSEQRKFLQHWEMPSVKWVFFVTRLVDKISELDLQISVAASNIKTHPKILLHEYSLQKAARYQQKIVCGIQQLGDRFYQVLQTEYYSQKTTTNSIIAAKEHKSADFKHSATQSAAFNEFIDKLPAAEFYNLLARSKKSSIATQSEVALDGSDWNADEAALLADLVPLTKVSIHADAKDAKQIVAGTSIAMPSSILLAYPASRTGINPDWEELVVLSDEKGDPNRQVADAKKYGAPILINPPIGIELIDFERFYQLLVRRLLPTLKQINLEAQLNQQSLLLILLTITSEKSLGHFDKNYINKIFNAALKRMLDEYSLCFSQYQGICINSDSGEQSETIQVGQQKIQLMNSRDVPQPKEQKTRVSSSDSERKPIYMVNLDHGDPFAWFSQESSPLDFVSKNFKNGRFIPIADANSSSYRQLISEQQFASVATKDWLMLEESKSAIAIKPVTPFELKHEYKKDSKEQTTPKISMLDNRNIQEAVKLFSELCNLYQIPGIIPPTTISLVSNEKIAYQVSLSGRALQREIENNLKATPRAKLLWDWCLKNIMDEKNTNACVELIKEILNIANPSKNIGTKQFLTQVLAQVYEMEAQSGFVYLAKALKYYQINEYRKKILGLPEEHKETKSAFESINSLTNDEFLPINPEVITLYHTILKEIDEKKDWQLLPLIQSDFFNFESLKNIKPDQIEKLNQWWNCRQILKNTIETYKRSLGFFNWYGAKRADELAKKLITHAPERDIKPELAEFLQTGKSDCDYTCYATLFSWSRASGTSKSSLRGRLIDELVAEEKVGESRDTRIERVISHAGEIKFKI